MTADDAHEGTAMGLTETAALRPGVLAYDENLKRTGDVAEVLGAWVHLRPNPPVPGYYPWTASLSNVRPATPEEAAAVWEETP
ncbi:hypothetical protein ACFZAM_12465 [Streptomyces sp. NPDC008079]|uniref:hypothetical protein n=1 Tax=Streptomyces sp. NPDC008079 TaxID=3364806 RepID=UPI0036EE3E45